MTGRQDLLEPAVPCFGLITAVTELMEKRVGQHREMLSHRAALVAAVVAANSLAPDAVAGNYCVVCYEPDAVYRCVIEGVAANLPADPRHQIQCIKELAQAGAHKRCSVERFTAAGCDGAVHVIAAGSYHDPAAARVDRADPRSSPSSSAGGQQRAGDVDPPPTGLQPEPVVEPKPTDPKAPPRTVEELASNAGEKTKQGLQDIGQTVSDSTRKVGEQIGSAAKKTWDCLTSFFSDC
jgi:hypothetical protein